MSAAASRLADQDARRSERAQTARQLVRSRASDTGIIGEHDVAAVLDLYGLPVVPQVFVRQPDDVAAAIDRRADELTGPFAVKVISPDIAHRSDVGGVILGVDGVAALRKAVGQVQDRCRAARPDARIDGALIAQMAPQGTEVIVGAHRDPTFGPIVVVGLGGVWAEAVDDVAIGIPPLTLETAESMTGSLRAAAVLRGERGGVAVNLPALHDVLIHIAQLAVDLGDVVESIDLNPVVVTATSIHIADGLITMAADAVPAGQ